MSDSASRIISRVLWRVCCVMFGLSSVASAAEPMPTFSDVAYGPDAKQKLHVWKVESAQPTPALLFIHGGGWVAGNRESNLNEVLPEMLAAGISVISMEYRFIDQAIDAGIKPPVKWPLDDAKRALQFVRSRATEWNLDKQRIAASGVSAGACSSLWLALHAEMAEPQSEDPIARESTRLWCAAVSGAQTSLDPAELKAWTPNSRYGGHAFGFYPNPKDLKTRDTQFAEFLAAREKVLPWIQEYSPYQHAGAGDPPIYLWYTAAPELGQPQKDPTHTANMGVKLQEKLRAAGCECELVYPGAPEIRHATRAAFLIAQLKKPAP